MGSGVAQAGVSSAAAIAAACDLVGIPAINGTKLPTVGDSIFSIEPRRTARKHPCFSDHMCVRMALTPVAYRSRRRFAISWLPAIFAIRARAASESSKYAEFAGIKMSPYHAPFCDPSLLPG